MYLSLCLFENVCICVYVFLCVFVWVYVYVSVRICVYICLFGFGRVGCEWSRVLFCSICIVRIGLVESVLVIWFLE